MHTRIKLSVIFGFIDKIGRFFPPFSVNDFTNQGHVLAKLLISRLYFKQIVSFNIESSHLHRHADFLIIYFFFLWQTCNKLVFN